MKMMPPNFEAIRKDKLKQIAIQLLPALIERASKPYDHAMIVQQAYKFTEEVVRQGGGR